MTRFTDYTDSRLISNCTATPSLCGATLIQHTTLRPLLFFSSLLSSSSPLTDPPIKLGRRVLYLLSSECRTSVSLRQPPPGPNRLLHPFPVLPRLAVGHQRHLQLFAPRLLLLVHPQPISTNPFMFAVLLHHSPSVRHLPVVQC